MSARQGSQPKAAGAPTTIPTRTWMIAAVTGAGAFVAMLDSTVANLAVESIRDDFDSTLTLVQWVVTGYLIALAVSLPAAGWLGNRYGFGRIWSISLAAFVAGSVLCAVAPGPHTLIGARFLQGLAAGLMVPAGQAVIGTVAGKDQLGRLMGTLGVVVSLGPALGPALGGVLIDAVSWRWLFWINVPVGVAALIAARGLVPSGGTNHGRPLDRSGLVLLSIGMPLLLYGATETGSGGVAALPVATGIIGAVLAAGFIFSAFRVTSPLIDLRLLRRPRFAPATVTTGLTGANMYGSLLLLPLYLQLMTDRGATETGLLLLAMGLGSSAALYAGGRLTDQHGAAPVIIVGGTLLVATTLPFLLPGRLPAVVLIALLVARGVGIALAQMPAMTAAYTAVDADQMGDATTLVNIVQRLGGAIGAAGLVILLAQAGGSMSERAYFLAFTALAVISTLTLIPALALRSQSTLNHGDVRATANQEPARSTASND